MFHIMPDDTGASAIWIAQRVPDDHITVVANQFVIAEFDLKDTKNFMGSANIQEVATRAKLWSPDQGPINFAK
ncbi:hypothetical protein EON63_02380 [archaeon]|nr:MAG: hypothetical protein EON63_02380 [archaeon]